ncbi:hypothetical protein [Nocardiopsis algeriensis]|uniref:Uncharacterized protein n=1 Tax=Nocardiopsis algeriensis TaxID=1478215 RepID=A0A841ISJ2_9ACTN|nr:hypothetical protein [Nocardiopsis algeriensis]MBB6121647.1 hypothetical protein [Nocardiopsis algeriensis]
MFPIADTSPFFFAVVYAVPAAFLFLLATSWYSPGRRHRVRLPALVMVTTLPLLCLLGFRHLPPGPMVSSALLLASYLLLVFELGLLGHGNAIRRASEQELSQRDPRVILRVWAIFLQMAVAALSVPIVAYELNLFPG